MKKNNIIEKLFKDIGDWLKYDGEENDIVISSRIRLARNLSDFPFINKASSHDLEEIEEIISNTLKNILPKKDYFYIPIHSLSSQDIFFLFERHLISRELVVSEKKRSIFLKKDESVSIMINEEDHIRIQFLKAGLDIENLWKEVNKLDDKIEEVLPYAFHFQFGYLTSCPTNVGTGLRASVMLHLPALNLTSQMDKVHKALKKHNVILRGFYGEGSEALGDFFQLSNQFTLGIKEEDIIKTINIIVPQILRYERMVREKMIKNNFSYLKEKINHALDILKNEEELSTRKALSCLSLIRLGVCLNIIEWNLQEINKLLMYSQPIHIQKMEGKELNNIERDRVRAKFLREHIKKIKLN